MNKKIILKLEQTHVFKTMKNSAAEILFSLSTVIFLLFNCFAKFLSGTLFIRVY